jgi:hypothetical protein
MKHVILFLAFAALGMTGAKAQTTETRELPPFTGIDIRSVAKVFIRQDSIQEVKIVSGEFSGATETKVNNSTLNIDGAGSTLYIAVPSLEKVEVSGRGSVIGQSAFTGKDLSIDIGGDGKVTLDVRYESLNASISGLGSIILSGAVTNANVRISGSGKVDAFDLKATNCNANISGLGKCNIDVTDNLNTNISGSGTVVYKNPPKNLAQNVSGLGRVLSTDAATIKRDTTHLTFGDSEVLIISGKDSLKARKKHDVKPIWGGLELGMNTYMTRDNSISLPTGWNGFELREEKSVSVGLNLLQKDVQLGKSNFWFLTGLGVTWNNYRFANNVSLSNKDGRVTANFDTTSAIKYQKSKLTSSYLTVPVLFEYFTSKDKKKAFHFTAGAMLGLRIGSHTKQKYELDGKTEKPKTYDNFYLNPFRYGARFAMGYGNFNLFADYYFSSLFKDNKGPELYPVNVGITLVGW